MLRLHCLKIDITSTDVYDNDSEYARIARIPARKSIRSGKLNHGLSQCGRTCGHCNSGHISQCLRRGNGEDFLVTEKGGN